MGCEYHHVVAVAGGLDDGGGGFTAAHLGATIERRKLGASGQALEITDHPGSLVTRRRSQVGMWRRRKPCKSPNLAASTGVAARMASAIEQPVSLLLSSMSDTSRSADTDRVVLMHDRARRCARSPFGVFLGHRWSSPIPEGCELSAARLISTARVEICTNPSPSCTAHGKCDGISRSSPECWCPLRCPYHRRQCEPRHHIRRLAEKKARDHAGFSFVFKARRQAHSRTMEPFSNKMNILAG